MTGALKAPVWSVKVVPSTLLAPSEMPSNPLALRYAVTACCMSCARGPAKGQRRGATPPRDLSPFLTDRWVSPQSYQISPTPSFPIQFPPRKFWYASRPHRVSLFASRFPFRFVLAGSPPLRFISCDATRHDPRCGSHFRSCLLHNHTKPTSSCSLSSLRLPRFKLL